jgi:O-antigen/teichoic acid export membrane protein
VPELILERECQRDPAAEPRSTFNARVELRRNVVALADQAAISGARFMATVLVGRFCGKESLGVYTLGMTFLLLAMGVLDALIATPYTVYGARLQGRRLATYTGSALMLAMLYAALCMAAFALAGTIFWAAGGLGDLGYTLWAVAILVPSLFLVEFVRRVAFTRLEVWFALWVDGTACFLQFGSLAALAISGWLTAPRAVVVWALAFGAVGIVGAILRRRWHSFELRDVPDMARQSWDFGRWAFASQLTLAVRSSAIPWLLALLLGAASTGAFAAFTTLILLANPLLLGIGNSMIPRAAAACGQGNRRDVRKIVAHATLLCTSATVLLGALLMLGSNQILTLFYGNQYTVESAVMALLVVGLLAEATGIPSSDGLWALERPRTNFQCSILGLAVTAVTAAALIVPLGLLGAAWAFCLGRIATAAAQCTAFWRATGEAGPVSAQTASEAIGGPERAPA